MLVHFSNGSEISVSGMLMFGIKRSRKSRLSTKKKITTKKKTRNNEIIGSRIRSKEHWVLVQVPVPEPNLLHYPRKATNSQIAGLP